MAFIRKANSVLFCFKCTDPLIKMRLFQSYCLSLYGSSLWRLDCDELNSLSVSFNNVIRRIWNLPRASHTSVVHSVGLVGSIYKIVYSRFSSLCTSAASQPSCYIHTIFTDSSHACNFLGYNYLYGASYCKSYSPHDVAIGSLIKEIRSESVTPNFSRAELDVIVCSVYIIIIIIIIITITTTTIIIIIIVN